MKLFKNLNYCFCSFFFISILLSCSNQQVEKNLANEKNEDTSLKTDSFAILYQFGNQKLNMNDFNGAIPLFSRAILLNPNDPNPFYCRGYALSAIGNDKAAIIDYNTTIKLRPDYKGAYFSRAVSYDVLGLYNEAIIDYDSVLAIDSLFSNAWFNRGLLKIKIGRKIEGINDIKRAADLKDPAAIQFLNKSVKSEFSPSSN